MKKNYRLIVIGAGPIGLACAIEAEKLGVDYLIVEKGALVNSLFHYPLYMTFFSTAERLEIGEIPFTCTASKPGRQEVLEYYRNIDRKFQFNLHLYEKVESVNRSDRGFCVVTSKQKYQADFVIVATGFYDIPNYLKVPGEELPKVSHYFKEAHPYSGQKLLIIGAVNSAVDAALECWRKGAEVTMVIRGKSLSDRVKYWVKPDIENRIVEGSIRAYFSSRVKCIEKTTVTIETPEGEKVIENDFVLAMTGYQPDFEFLQRIGVRLSNDPLKIPEYCPETMETNVRGLYLAGVVCGGMETHKWFIENSRVHAELILRDIIKKISS